MKNALRYVLLCCLLLVTAISWAVTVQVGSGTSTSTLVPVRTRGYYNYTQQIYTQAQINKAGLIRSLSFYFSTGGATNSSPWVVYLGHTSKTQFTSNTDWVASSSLTQVYSGAVTITAGAWTTVTFATPFLYNNVDNLVVAIDENNSARANSEGNWYAFTSGSNTGIYVNRQTPDIDPASPPTGTRVSSIPQVRFDMNVIADPTSVTATPASGTQVDLTWVRNSTPDNVMVAWNTTNTFGTPVDGTSYSVSGAISGGGTVIYNGSGTGFSHSSLTQNSTYYYKVWSVGNDGAKAVAYSPGVTANAQTPISSFPFVESFDGATYPPTNWVTVKTAGSGTGLWDRVTSGTNPTATPFTGAGMSRFSSDTFASGTRGILATPPLRLPAEGYSISFRMFRDNTTGADQVNVYINTQNNLTGATLLGTINRLNTAAPAVGLGGNAGGWFNYTIDLPAGSSSGTRYLVLEGVSAAGNNIFVDDFTVSAITTTFPTATPRYVAEWEPAKGAIVSYSGEFGLPNAMLRDMSNAGPLYVIRSAANATACTSALTTAGVNFANVVYITANVDTYWVRDYGPWTVFDGNNQMKYIDFNYNRPRYNDDATPGVLASSFGLDMFTMNYMATGGNVMTDGYGKAMSTNLVLNENTLLTETYINQMFQNYLGVTDYYKFTDPLTDSTIDHMDCWGKLLDVDKVLIARVPSGNANYAALEAAVTAWQSKTSSYGTPYRIYRVDCPSNQPYTNSYIYNKKIYVPQMAASATAADLAAQAVYANAMPGYTIVGYYWTVAKADQWLSTDAIHCRVNTRFDDKMVFVRHIPVRKACASGLLTISADITSSYPVANDSTYVSYRYWDHTTSKYTNWVNVPLSFVSGKTWSASIPTPAVGDSLQYTVRATDSMGSTAYRSLCGRLDPFRVLISEYHYKSNVSTGNWSDISSWLYSTDNVNWYPAFETPTAGNSSSITILNGHTITMGSSTGIDQMVINTGGMLIVGAGAALTVNNGTGTDFAVNGYLTVTGSLGYSVGALMTAGANSTIEFNGTTAQSTGTGFPAIVNNLIINNPAGVNITNTTDIDGTLTQTAGSVTGAPTPDGYYSMLNHLEFPETGNVISGWSIAMSTPDNFPARIDRQWSITGSYAGTKTLTFYWTSIDDHSYDWVGNGKIPSVYQGATEIVPISYSVSSSPRTATIVLSASMSKAIYTIGPANEETLPVELSSFTAAISAQNNVLLQWVTQSETNVVGYRIYRGTSEDVAQANMLNTFIQGTNTSQTQVYAYNDTEIYSDGTYYYWLENLDFDGTGSLHGPVSITIEHTGSGTPNIPIVQGIDTAYPNPFNPSLTIRVGTVRNGQINVSVYNQRGQQVRVLMNEVKDSGRYTLTWDAKDASGRLMPSGIYFIRMYNDGKVFNHKVVLMK